MNDILTILLYKVFFNLKFLEKVNNDNVWTDFKSYIQPFLLFDSQRTASNKNEVIPHLNACTDSLSARFSLAAPSESAP